MDEMQLNQQLSAIFFIESAEMLSESSFALLKAEAAGDPSVAIHQVFRAIHSIKGGSQSLGFEGLADVSHRMEDFMVPFQHGEYAIDGQIVSLILESMDVIEGQLKSYQSGQAPDQCTHFLDKLAEVTLSIGHKSDVLHNSMIVNAQEETNNKSQPLLYISFIVDQAAAMPGITAFMLLDRLRSSGRLLYSQPDIDGSSIVKAGEPLMQVAIIETDMSHHAVKQEAYAIGDIRDLKIADINSRSFLFATLPTKQEIGDFNDVVATICKELCNKKSNKGILKTLLLQLATWGETSRGTVGWFPGGLGGWNRLHSLLAETLLSATLTSKTHLAHNILRVLWETVYHALCNQTYFYRVPASEIFAGQELQIISQLEQRAVDLQMMIIDLSSWEVLELDHLTTLMHIRNKMMENGCELRFVSEGKYTRRHVRVLEISQSLVGHLDFHSSAYSAVITREDCE